MKVRTRAACGAQAADCGHVVADGHVVVRRGRRWVCAMCSLPGNPLWDPARCGSCGQRMGSGSRMALRADGQWCHRECCATRPLALVTVTEGYQTALGGSQHG